MISYNSKVKFSEFKKNSHYLRVDEIHPLEILIGLNDSGQKTLRFIGSFSRAKVKGTKTIDVNHYIINNKMAISFSLTDYSFEDLFYLFCNDLIDSSRNINQEQGYAFLVNRYEKWKGFSNSTRKYLSENEIKGLIGELIFLKDELIDLYGVSKSISGWSAPEPTKKDFSYDDIWYEVKVVSKGTVSISSIEQLDSDREGYLVIYHFEKISPESHNISINSLVNEIFSKIEIDTDRTEFILKLVQVGYYKEDYYDDFVFSITKKDFYLVNSDFPRLIREDINKAIYDAKYELIINMLEGFKRDKI